MDIVMAGMLSENCKKEKKPRLLFQQYERDPCHWEQILQSWQIPQIQSKWRSRMDAVAEKEGRYIKSLCFLGLPAFLVCVSFKWP